MVRPMKEYRTKENKNFLQLYHKGEYVGNIQFKELCQLIKDKADNGTKVVMAQDNSV